MREKVELPPDEILQGTKLLTPMEVLTKMLRRFPNRQIEEELPQLERQLGSYATDLDKAQISLQEAEDHLAEHGDVLKQSVPLVPPYKATEKKTIQRFFVAAGVLLFLLIPASQVEDAFLILLTCEVFIFAMAAIQYLNRSLGERQQYREFLSKRQKVQTVKQTYPELQWAVTKLQNSYSRNKERYSYLLRAAAFEYKPDNAILWGGYWYPQSVASEGLLVVGAQGTGKTLIIKLLMRSVLPHIGKIRNHRALIYDFKREIYPFLIDIGVPKERIKIFNPLDKRTVGWAIWKDVKHRSTAEQIGHILIPSDAEEHANSYFKNAARDLLVGAMTVFLILSNDHEKKTGHPIKWTLKDVFLAMTDPETLKAHLQRTDETKGLISDYFEPEKTFKSVWGTAKTYVRKLSIVAAIWSHATEYISLSEWVKDNDLDESILIIGSDPKHDVTISAINRVILQIISEHLRAPEKKPEYAPKTWLFLDELVQLGKFESLDDLFGVGREMGICLVLGIQDPAQLRKEGRYKEAEAEVILGLSKNKIMLGVEGDTAREWCSKQFGDVERRKYVANSNVSDSEQWGTNWGRNAGTNWSTNESRNEGTNWSDNTGTNWSKNQGGELVTEQG